MATADEVFRGYTQQRYIPISNNAPRTAESFGVVTPEEKRRRLLQIIQENTSRINQLNSEGAFWGSIANDLGTTNKQFSNKSLNQTLGGSPSYYNEVLPMEIKGVAKGAINLISSPVSMVTGKPKEQIEDAIVGKKWMEPLRRPAETPAGQVAQGYGSVIPTIGAYAAGDYLGGLAGTSLASNSTIASAMPTITKALPTIGRAAGFVGTGQVLYEKPKTTANTGNKALDTILNTVEQSRQGRVIGDLGTFGIMEGVNAGVGKLKDIYQTNKLSNITRDVARDVLNVSKDASPEEIKSAYNNYAKMYHPDVNPGNENAFDNVTTAYRVLTGETFGKEALSKAAEKLGVAKVTNNGVVFPKLTERTGMNYTPPTEVTKVNTRLETSPIEQTSLALPAAGETAKPAFTTKQVYPFTEKTGMDYTDLTVNNSPFWNNEFETFADYAKRAKGYTGKVLYMTPDEYITNASKGFGLMDGNASVEDTLRFRNKDKVAKYAEAMKRGDKFPALSLEYNVMEGGGIGFSQEGLHRAMAAKEAGIERVPVVVKAPTGKVGKNIFKMVGDAPNSYDPNYEQVSGPMQVKYGTASVPTVDVTAEKVPITYKEIGAELGRTRAQIAKTTDPLELENLKIKERKLTSTYSSLRAEPKPTVPKVKDTTVAMNAPEEKPVIPAKRTSIVEPDKTNIVVKGVNALRDYTLGVFEPGKLVERNKTLGKGVYADVIKAIHTPEAEELAFEHNFGQLEQDFDQYPKSVLRDLMLTRGNPVTPEGQAIKVEAFNRLPEELKKPEVQANITQITDYNYNYLTNGGSDVGYKEDYWNGSYKSKNVKVPEYLKSTNRNELEKTFATPADAYSRGFDLRNNNPVTNAREEYKAVARRRALEDLKSQLETDGMDKYVWTTETAPERAVVIQDPVFNGLAVEPDLGKLINSLISTNKIYQNPISAGLAVTGNTIRQIKFAVSAYHLTVEASQAIADSSAGELVKGKPAKEIFSRGFLKDDPTFQTPEYKEYVSLGGGHKFSIEEQALVSMKKLIGGIEELGTPGRYVGKVVGLPLRDFPDWLFESYIPKMKYVKYLDNVAQVESRLGRQLTNAERIDIIKEGQNFYGEMNERLFGRSGTVTTLLRIPFQAPGFGEGNMRTTAKAVLQWGDVKEGVGETVRGGAGRSRRAIIQSFIMKAILATATTAILTGKLPKAPKRKEDIRDIFKVDTGKQDDKGREVYIDTLTYDKDYWNVLGNIAIGRFDKAGQSLMDRIAGMKSSSFDIATDLVKVMMGQTPTDYKGEPIYNETDSFGQKILKLSAYEDDKLLPISYGVYAQANKEGQGKLTSLISAFVGLRTTTSEQEKENSKTVQKAFLLKDELNNLYSQLDNNKDAKKMVDDYNKKVDRVIGESGLRDEDKQSWMKSLHVNLDTYIQNKVYNLRTETDTKSQQTITKILKNLGVDVSPENVDNILNARKERMKGIYEKSTDIRSASEKDQAAKDILQQFSTKPTELKSAVTNIIGGISEQNKQEKLPPDTIIGNFILGIKTLLGQGPKDYEDTPIVVREKNKGQEYGGLYYPDKNMIKMVEQAGPYKDYAENQILTHENAHANFQSRRIADSINGMVNDTNSNYRFQPEELDFVKRLSEEQPEIYNNIMKTLKSSSLYGKDGDRADIANELYAYFSNYVESYKNNVLPQKVESIITGKKDPDVEDWSISNDLMRYYRK